MCPCRYVVSLWAWLLATFWGTWFSNRFNFKKLLTNQFCWMIIWILKLQFENAKIKFCVRYINFVFTNLNLNFELFDICVHNFFENASSGHVESFAMQLHNSEDSVPAMVPWVLFFKQIITCHVFNFLFHLQFMFRNRNYSSMWNYRFGEIFAGVLAFGRHIDMIIGYRYLFFAISF